MKDSILCLMLLLSYSVSANTVFDDVFEPRTLRLDYIFAGDDNNTAIYLEECGIYDGWAGRRHNLEQPFLKGNGAFFVCDAASGDTIYSNSFSTLFQEWQHTDEAAKVAKAFETTLLSPFPKNPVNISVNLYDNNGNTVAALTHPLDPKDILIRHIPKTQANNRYVHQGGSPDECIDIAIVAEGYTADDEDKFFKDAERASEALLSHEPFASMADKFNILAVATLSGDSGPDVPREGIWNRTAHRSHYDTFYSDRYLTTQSLHEIYESIAGLPVEHIILMVNTPRYGGGGIFNQITICTSDHPTFKEVLVHEFGHAYGGLADEYYYPGDDDTTYSTETEPWEPNITSLVDLQSKWADLIPTDTPVPTPVIEGINVRKLNKNDKKDADLLKSLTQKVGVYEGAGYREHGLYRPVQECRMKVNEVDYFCPVCTRAIKAITDWYTE